MSIDFKKPTPLYLQIVDHIKKQINSGHYKENDQLGSQQELARQYNVSLITVKRAINELIKEKVLYSRVGKGTYVSENFQKLSFSDHVNIGLILRDLKSPFFARIVESVEERASQLDYNLLVATSANQVSKEDKHIQRFLDMGVHGIIIGVTTARFHASKIILDMHRRNFPYVIVSYIADENINYISTDHKYGAFLATEYLIKLGYNTIGYINTEEGFPLGEIRKSGFLNALSKYDKEFHPEFVYRIRERGEWHEYESGYEIGLSVSRLAKRPEAMFIYNDITALGFEKALLEQGMCIPKDMALVGFDNIKRGRVATVPLTTVEQPTGIIGKSAVDALVNLIADKPVKFPIILKPRLVLRNSTPDPKVNKTVKVSDQKMVVK